MKIDNFHTVCYATDMDTNITEAIEDYREAVARNVYRQDEDSKAREQEALVSLHAAIDSYANIIFT